jgi:hypothetical protein
MQRCCACARDRPTQRSSQPKLHSLTYSLCASCPQGSIDAGDRPDPCGTPCFSSILSASWAIISTITTVGYGDSYPASTFGRVVATCASIVGIIIVALPIATFQHNFMRVHTAREVCTRMLKDVTGHLSTPINAKMLRLWLDIQIAEGDLLPVEADVDAGRRTFNGEDVTSESWASAGRVSNAALASLAAPALIEQYDLDGKGHLDEDEALLMLADIDEFHGPYDTVKLNACVHEMAHTLQESVARTLSVLEKTMIGQEHSRKMTREHSSLVLDQPTGHAEGSRCSFACFTSLLASIVKRSETDPATELSAEKRRVRAFQSSTQAPSAANEARQGTGHSHEPGCAEHEGDFDEANALWRMSDSVDVLLPGKTWSGAVSFNN